jgi:hypothetical protein
MRLTPERCVVYHTYYHATYGAAFTSTAFAAAYRAIKEEHKSLDKGYHK